MRPLTVCLDHSTSGSCTKGLRTLSSVSACWRSTRNVTSQHLRYEPSMPVGPIPSVSVSKESSAESLQAIELRAAGPLTFDHVVRQSERHFFRPLERFTCVINRSISRTKANLILRVGDNPGPIGSLVTGPPTKRYLCWRGNWGRRGRRRRRRRRRGCSRRGGRPDRRRSRSSTWRRWCARSWAAPGTSPADRGRRTGTIRWTRLDTAATTLSKAVTKILNEITTYVYPYIITGQRANRRYTRYDRDS